MLKNGEHGQVPGFILTSNAAYMEAVSALDYSISDHLPFITTLSTQSMLTGTYLAASIGTFTNQTAFSYRGDINYQTKTPVSIYVQENFNGLVDFEFSCSASVTITADIVAHPDTGTFPSWVSVDPGMAHLNVSAPAFGQTNVYYFNVRETITGQTYDRSVELHVLGCNVDN